MAYDKVVDSAFLEAGLKKVGDSIRAKAGTSELLEFPDAMAAAVTGITGGEDLDDVLTEQGELIDAINSVLVEQGVKTVQAKTVAPSLEEQTVTPDAGYLINEIKVEPITTELLVSLDSDLAPENINEGVEILGVTGTLLGRKPEQAKTVTPSLEVQNITPDEGYAISGVTVGAVDAELLAILDTDFKAANIAEGVNMFGVTGTLEGRIPEQAVSAIPSLDEQTITPDSGYVINEVTVAPVTADLLANLDTDFTAANIAEGVELFGVTGTHVGGGVKFDVVTVSSLPAAVVNNQIVVLTGITPTKISVSTYAPAEPVEGDIWVVIGDSTYGIAQVTEGTNVIVTFTGAKRYDGTEWVTVWGYVGMSGVWEKFSEGVLPVIGTPLNDCSWADISNIASAGLASSYFAVGDTKAVYIKGTVGTLEVDNTYYAYIIGFDHNGATNTIDFGTFKTAASSGVDVCLIDGNYNSYSTDGTKYFNMNHSSNRNSGGWKGCDLRYDVLGSTNADGADAGTTTATSPVPGTLMAALPSELRAVMKPMTIYTDNTGGGSDTASYVTASVDYLPLLAEFEIFGTRTYANSAEQNYQKQYTYYANGNSKKKYKHSATVNTADWRGRSPVYNGISDFCYVRAGGAAYYTPAYFSYGLAPIFRV